MLSTVLVPLLTSLLHISVDRGSRRILLWNELTCGQQKRTVVGPDRRPLSKSLEGIPREGKGEDHTSQIHGRPVGVSPGTPGTESVASMSTSRFLPNMGSTPVILGPESKTVLRTFSTGARRPEGLDNLRSTTGKTGKIFHRRIPMSVGYPGYLSLVPFPSCFLPCPSLFPSRSPLSLSFTRSSRVETPGRHRLCRPRSTHSVFYRENTNSNKLNPKVVNNGSLRSPYTYCFNPHSTLGCLYPDPRQFQCFIDLTRRDGGDQKSRLPSLFRTPFLRPDSGSGTGIGTLSCPLRTFP